MDAKSSQSVFRTQTEQALDRELVYLVFDDVDSVEPLRVKNLELRLCAQHAQYTGFSRSVSVSGFSMFVRILQIVV